jgi:hypothetical protein
MVLHDVWKLNRIRIYLLEALSLWCIWKGNMGGAKLHCLQVFSGLLYCFIFCYFLSVYFSSVPFYVIYCIFTSLLAYQSKSRGFDSLCHWMFYSIYVILAEALWPWSWLIFQQKWVPENRYGVWWKARPARKAVSLTAICEPIVEQMWDHRPPLSVTGIPLLFTVLCLIYLFYFQLCCRSVSYLFVPLIL